MQGHIWSMLKCRTEACQQQEITGWPPWDQGYNHKVLILLKEDLSLLTGQGALVPSLAGKILSIL